MFSICGADCTSDGRIAGLEPRLRAEKGESGGQPTHPLEALKQRRMIGGLFR